MTSPQTSVRPNTLAPLALAKMPPLTAGEWELILEALSAYQHHAAFRVLYEKLAARRIHA